MVTDEETVRSNCEIESILYRDSKTNWNAVHKKPITDVSFDTSGIGDNIRAPGSQAASTTSGNLSSSQ